MPYLFGLGIQARIGEENGLVVLWAASVLRELAMHTLARIKTNQTVQLSSRHWVSRGFGRQLFVVAWPDKFASLSRMPSGVQQQTVCGRKDV